VDLVLLGNIDPSFNLAPPAKVHGDYEPAQIPALVARYGIGCWLIPSIWPETFSYTTHEALATGLPVICFDLGAQAEAVRRAEAQGAPGAVLPLPNGRADATLVLAAAKRLVAQDPAAED
jgi:O-antigen biosynthesis protein